MKLTDKQILEFQTIVLNFFKEQGRDLPWRRTDDPYAILVSEVMLQQTQVSRVIEKYKIWIRRFPTVFELAATQFEEILPYWIGLGYNRRALYLKRCADDIVSHHRGIFPTTYKSLNKLPGIGDYTARALCVFAFNQPIPLLETNVRSVMIHHFFKLSSDIDDADLWPVIEATMDKTNPRRWFNALMDYGVFLKQDFNNPSRKSSHYIKQKPLKGSVREVRGYILKCMSLRKQMTFNDLNSTFPNSENRIQEAIKGLKKDGLLSEDFRMDEA